MLKKTISILSCLFFYSCSVPNTTPNSSILNTSNESIDQEVLNKMKFQNYENAYSSYSFSEDFINKIKNYSQDKLINKSEIESLLKNSNQGEKKFINLIENKDSFIMSSLKSNKEIDQIEFIIVKNRSITGDFLKKVNTLIQDNLLEKSEIDNLLKSSNDEEKGFITDLINYDVYNNFSSLNNDNKLVENDLNIYYDENQIIHGNSTFEILSNIGQADRLIDTYTDESRCGSSLILNSILLVRGKEGFYNFSKKIGYDFKDFTYKNIHLAQERLMTRVPSFRGLSIRSSIVENNIQGGTFFKALNLANIKWKNDFVGKINYSYKEELESHLVNQPNNAVILTDYIYKEKEKKINKENEHASLLTYKYGYYYLTDTSGRNGSGLNHIRLTDKDMKEIYKNNSPLIKITI